MKRSDVPEPWASAMLDARVVDPRYGRPSWSALAREVGVHTSTITAMVNGTRETSPEIIERVAIALRQTPRTISQWLNVVEVREAYEPPEESRYLTDAERAAISALISAIAAERKAGDQGAEQRSTPSTTEGSTGPDNVTTGPFGSGSRRNQMIEDSTTEVEAARGPGEGGMRNRSTIHGGAVSGAEPDDENQDTGDDDWSGA